MFDLLFRPFESADPLYSLAAVSLVSGAGMVFVFRFTSDQKAIRQIKDRILAQLLAVRIFRHEIREVGKAYAQILRGTLVYLRQSMKPLAVLLVPLVLLLVQVEMRMEWIAPKINDSFLLKAKLSKESELENVSLRLPEGLSLSAPPLKIPSEMEVDWRIRAAKKGDFQAEVAVGTQTYTKQIVVSDRLLRLSPERVRSSLLAWMLQPGERALPRDGPLESLAVSYRAREIEFGPFRGHWLVVFLVLSLFSGFITKTVFRIEL